LDTTYGKHTNNNELSKDICSEEKKPTKPTKVGPLDKWELKDKNDLALLKSFVNEEMYIHIENEIDAWYAWNILKYFFDTQPEIKRVDLN
jgi:hypothetical protein